MTRPAVLETDPAVWRAEALDYIEARVRAGHQVTADDLRRHSTRHGIVLERQHP